MVNERLIQRTFDARELMMGLRAVEYCCSQQIDGRIRPQPGGASARHRDHHDSRGGIGPAVLRSAGHGDSQQLRKLLVDNFARAIKRAPHPARAYAVGRRDRLFDVRALLTWLTGGSLGGRVGVCFRSSRASFPRHSRIHAETLDDVAGDDLAGDDAPRGDVAGRDRWAGRVSFLDVTKARLLFFGGKHAFLSP